MSRNHPTDRNGAMRSGPEDPHVTRSILQELEVMRQKRRLESWCQSSGISMNFPNSGQRLKAKETNRHANYSGSSMENKIKGAIRDGRRAVHHLVVVRAAAPGTAHTGAALGRRHSGGRAARTAQARAWAPETAPAADAPSVGLRPGVTVLGPPLLERSCSSRGSPAPHHWDQRAGEEGPLPAERLHPSRGPCAVGGREARAVPRPEPPAGVHRPLHRDPGGVKKVLPPDEIEQVAVKRGTKTSLTTVVKETSCLMMRMQGVSHMLAHPLRVISARCVVQFVGGRPSTAEKAGLLGFFVGLIPHLLGGVVSLRGCNLPARFLSAYLVGDSVGDTPGGLGSDQNPGSRFGQALAIQSHPRFVMGMAVSVLAYPFLLVGGLMAVNTCRLGSRLTPQCSNPDPLLEGPECAGPVLPKLQPASLPGVIRIIPCPGVT
eukprot:bmy_19029T0